MNELFKTIPNDHKYSGLKAHLASAYFSDTETDMLRILIDTDQLHMFSDWDLPGIEDQRKKDFFNQLSLINNSYPGGIPNYIKNARILLRDAQNDVNPFEGYFPEQPDTVNLTKLDDTYANYENLAMQHLAQIGIVLVAGGLGERLGYSGIKLDIPIEMLTNTTYLQHYTSVIKAMELRTNSLSTRIPLIIMTSRDTHDKTTQSLEKNNYFGLDRNQIIILKQELVPALADNDGHIAMNGKYDIALKPHGHGDIHMLLHTSGTAERLYKNGTRHLLFIQDTNGQVFNAAFAAIGVSIKHDFDFNSIAVNRIPCEAVGAIAKLKKKNSEFTLNVEYNQLDPLLRATVSPDGDVPDKNGFSIFPGNINVLILKLDTYKQVLNESGGIIAEFVNPKYSDSTRSQFKKPTRLETMMQDLPKLFNADHKVGVTIFDRKWCFSADKNNLSDAKAKHTAGGPPESASTAESDFYLANRKKLSIIGAHLRECPEELILGIPFIRGPKVILSPSCALNISDVKQKLKNIELSDEATLIINGPDVFIDGLKMKGPSALIIDAVPGAKVIIKNQTISNAGFELIKINQTELNHPDTPEYIKIRGYRFDNKGAQFYRFDQPGEYNID